MSDDERYEDFVRLFARHNRRVFAYIMTLLPNEADAEDVFQETSTVLWRKFDQFEPGTDFVAWATKVAYFQVQNCRRRLDRSRLVFSDAMVETLAVERTAMAESLELQRDALSDCIRELHASDRKLIKLRYGVGLAVKSISEQIDKPLRTVYRSLERVRRTLVFCTERVLTAEARD